MPPATAEVAPVPEASPEPEQPPTPSEPEPEPEQPPTPSEPEPEPAPEPEPEPAPEPESRCEAETTVGGNLYRCALAVGHDDDHRFQTIEAPEPGGDDGQAAIDKAIPKLEAEARRHAGRIRDIMGADADGLIVCELCVPVIPGFRWASAPDEATTQRVRAAIGLPSLDNYRPSSTEHVCDDCAGLGKVRTGSQVERYATATCDACEGKGWVPTRDRLHAPPAALALAAVVNADEPERDDGIIRDMFGTPETDPDYGKMPNMRVRPVDYWQTHRE